MPDPASQKRAPNKPAPGAITPDTPIGHVVFYAGERYLVELASAERRRAPLGTPVFLLVLGVGLTALGISGLGGGVTLAGLAGIAAGVLTLLVALMALRPYPQLPPERVAELEALDAQIASAFERAGVRCHGCDAASVETFAAGARVHGFECEPVLAALNAALDLDLSIYAEGSTPAARPAPKN